MVSFETVRPERKMTNKLNYFHEKELLSVMTRNIWGDRQDGVVISPEPEAVGGGLQRKDIWWSFMFSIQGVNLVLLSLRRWRATATLQGAAGWRRCEWVCHRTAWFYCLQTVDASQAIVRAESNEIQPFSEPSNNQHRVFYLACLAKRSIMFNILISSLNPAATHATDLT